MEIFVDSTKHFQQKFGWPNKVFRLNMGQWKFSLIQQNIFLGVNDGLYKVYMEILPNNPVEINAATKIDSVLQLYHGQWIHQEKHYIKMF